MTLIPARRLTAEARQAYVRLCVLAEKHGLAVELTTDNGRLEVVRVVRPGAGRTAIKLVEARITDAGLDDAAAGCLAILARERRS